VVDCLPGKLESLSSNPRIDKKKKKKKKVVRAKVYQALGMVVNDRNSSTWEVEAGG
jgi:hypothetical protein